MTIAPPPVRTTPDLYRMRPPGEIAHKKRALLLALVAFAGWTTSLVISQIVQVGPLLHEIALFVHLASLVAGLGSVLSIDYFGLQWLLGRRSMSEVVTVATCTSTLVWVGFTGLVVTGAFLSPDLSSPLTQAKLGLVLMVGINGAIAGIVQHRLGWSSRRPSRMLLAQGALVATVSQVGWWGAVVVGFLNSQS